MKPFAGSAPVRSLRSVLVATESGPEWSDTVRPVTMMFRASAPTYRIALGREISRFDVVDPQPTLQRESRVFRHWLDPAPAMSARTSIWSTCRALAIRSRPIAPRARPYAVGQSRRWYADESRHNPSAQPLSSSQIPEEAQEVPAAEKGSLEPADQPAVRGAVEAAKQVRQL